MNSPFEVLYYVVLFWLLSSYFCHFDHFSVLKTYQYRNVWELATLLQNCRKDTCGQIRCTEMSQNTPEMLGAQLVEGASLD